MSGNDEELEFISVAPDDDNELNNYMDPLTSGESNTVVGSWILNQSKHPVTIVFHLLFKSLALFIYVFGSWITSNFIFTFVICIVLLAFDFWTVKNISGRLLVGLRWWSYVKEDGSNEWIFESLEDMAEISAVDSRMFWGGLYVSPLCWSLLLVVGVLRLKFEYMPIVGAALVLNLANIIGYLKCSSSAKEKVKSMMEQGMKQGSMAALENSSIRNWVLESLLAITATGASSSRANSGAGAV
ncbi:hypothetical protein B484DRAFT_441912 [Ochromonadaceae sp. CCMP2298]|nr:hypothetical protein B484DRAFT_441912 [Ochromonadaceae sp. CCMP2298]